MILSSFFLILSSFIVILFLISLQTFFHNKRLSSFRFRIHINGTRGKSSVTRLIHAGLNEAGISSFAKTTGTLASMIYPDGKEKKVNRWNKASIKEQIEIVKEAKKVQAEALIIECMALDPRYQMASEIQIIKSNIGVITNIREDHLEIMGPTKNDIAKAFASAIPKNGAVFIGEANSYPILTKASIERNSKIIPKNSSDPEFTYNLNDMKYWEHKDNIDLALEVCQYLGVPKPTAWKGMKKMNPDPGALQIIPIQYFSKNIIFINAMAANDPFSTRLIWQDVTKQFPYKKKFSILLHCRKDRIERSEQLANELINWEPIDSIFLTGNKTSVAWNILNNPKNKEIKILDWENYSPELIFESLLTETNETHIILGIGNIGNHGLEIIQYLKNRSIHMIEKGHYE